MKRIKRSGVRRSNGKIRLSSSDAAVMVAALMQASAVKGLVGALAGIALKPLKAALVESAR